MATILPAKQQDYSGFKRAMLELGQGFERQAMAEQEHQWRLDILDEEYKKRNAASLIEHIQRNSEADYAAGLQAESIAATKEYESDLDAATMRIARKYAPNMGPVPQVGAKPDKSVKGDQTVMPKDLGPKQSSSPEPLQSDPLQDSVTIYRQGKPIVYTEAELLQKSKELGFWSTEENRFITYNEQKNKGSIDFLNKQIEAESSLIAQRKSSEIAENWRTELTKVQTKTAELNLTITKEAFEQDKTARDTTDVILTAHLADILTSGKYSKMSPEEQTSIRENLRAKDPKSDDPAKRISKLDRHRHFYNDAARESLRTEFAKALVPKEVDESDVPIPGKVQYQDKEGRVETAMHLYDKLYRDYAIQGRYEEAKRLPLAITQAMKMYTMDGALPIKLSEMNADGTKNLTLTKGGADVVIAIQALMNGNYEQPDPPLKDDVRSMWEQQIADLEERGLRVKPSDTQEEMYAKLGGMYSALAYHYVNARNQFQGEPFPRYDKTIAIAGSLIGVPPQRAREMVSQYADAVKKDPTIASKTEAYKSEFSARFESIFPFAKNEVFAYNLPGQDKVVTTRFAGKYYPEYFSDVPKRKVPSTEEVKAREMMGSLINDFTRDNGEYINPGQLSMDLKRYNIGQNSEIFQQLISEYEARYNSKNLPSIKK